MATFSPLQLGERCSIHPLEKSFQIKTITFKGKPITKEDKWLVAFGIDYPTVAGY
jgi:hypothetical protein